MLNYSAAYLSLAKKFFWDWVLVSPGLVRIGLKLKFLSRFDLQPNNQLTTLGSHLLWVDY